MEYIKEITVDLVGEMLFEYITAVQGDTKSRYVKVTILSNAQPYTLPSGATAVIRCKKPDGTSVFNDAVINSDGTITAELTTQMLAAVGNCRCEISLYGADKSSLTSVPFIVKVTPSAVNPEITSTDEYTALISALNRVDDVSSVANTALEASTAALNNLSNIEADIDAHTAAAQEATNNANMAATAAESAAVKYKDKLDLIQQLKDMCSGKAYVSYTDVGPLPSHSGKLIETVFAPVCTEVGMAKFNNCEALKNLYLPAAEDVSGSFMNCTALTEVYLPSVKFIGANAFDGCLALTTLDLGANIMTIGNYAFRNCTELTKLILRAPAVVTMQNSGAMTGTKYIAGNRSAVIYVPDELVESYKTATNWVYFAVLIKPLSELEA